MNQFDIDLMLALNFDGWRFLDAIMWFASGIPNWIPLYLFVLYIVYRKHGWKYALFAFLFIAAGVGICDQVCNFFKSDMTPYLRPTRTEILPQLHTINGYIGGKYGTVSGHASTSFCVFLLSSLMVRRGWFTGIMLTYTLLTSYSRIYLGVHFPFQILFGIILGTIVALSLWQLFKYLCRRFGWHNPPSKKSPGEPCANNAG